MILDIARDLLTGGGLGAVSFGSIAARLGRSKQAVLYWYPTKADLLAALFLPWLEEEAALTENAVRNAPDPEEAIARFVRAIAAFHLSDLTRFRAMYVLPQTLTRGAGDPRDSQVLDRVHKITDRLYAALAAQLGPDPVAARQQALALHSAVLGLSLMAGLAEGLDDPLKHGNQAMIEALVARLTP
ncbi:TetR/AcrR family transcriptional regulator [Nioella aestuarii]